MCSTGGSTEENWDEHCEIEEDLFRAEHRSRVLERFPLEGAGILADRNWGELTCSILALFERAKPTNLLVIRICQIRAVEFAAERIIEYGP